MSPSELISELARWPDGALVPVAWIREKLAQLPPDRPAGSADVLDVAGLAARWKRSASAVRALLEAQAIPEAWKQGGRAWRVRLADVVAYESSAAASRQRAEPTVNLRAIARGDRSP